MDGESRGMFRDLEEKYEKLLKRVEELEGIKATPYYEEYIEQQRKNDVSRMAAEAYHRPFGGGPW